MDRETGSLYGTPQVIRDPPGCGPRKVRKLALDQQQGRCPNAQQLQSLDSNDWSSEQRLRLWERWR